jgi:hypothetical protein
MNEEKTQLLASGFQAQRFGLVVNFVRRLLWPLIRPFHFYHLNNHIKLMERLEDNAPYLAHSPSGSDLTYIAEIRSEVAALSNRLAITEHELASLHEELKSLRAR